MKVQKSPVRSVSQGGQQGWSQVPGEAGLGGERDAAFSRSAGEDLRQSRPSCSLLPHLYKAAISLPLLVENTGEEISTVPGTVGAQ